MKLEDLSIGDWVQAVQGCGVEGEERLSPPMRIVSLGAGAGGWVNLMIDPEQGDPFEYEPCEIRGIDITQEMLEKSGFEKKNYDNGKMWDWVCDNICVRKFADEDSYRCIIMDSVHHRTSMVFVNYTHQIQHALRLAGIEKEIEV